MAGSKKQAASTKRNQGDDFHARIGAKGGKAKNPRKGFGGLSPERRQEISRLGGSRSKR